jgi:hypothetical protein
MTHSLIDLALFAILLLWFITQRYYRVWFWFGILFGLYLLGRLLNYALEKDKLIEGLAFTAGLLAALVIYYEVEVGRAARFLGELYGRGYKGRRRIYRAFARVEIPPGVQDQNPAAVFQARRDAFFALLQGNTARIRRLRKECDLQLSLLATAQYSLRRSLLPNNRRLMSITFPHVIVRLWLMLGRYALEERERVPTGYDALTPVVLESIAYLRRIGIPSLKSIRVGGPNPVVVQIPEEAWKMRLPQEIEMNKLSWSERLVRYFC